MPFALKLFKINFQNTYYTNEIDNDFDVIPDQKTYHFMHEHNMRLITYRGTVELIWLTANFENPLQIFEQKLAEHHLNFYLQVKNIYLFNFSSLSVDQTHIYYLTNSTSSQKLHKREYLSEEDKIPIQTIVTIVNNPANIFGIINIQLDKLWKGEIDIKQLPIEYVIQIKARETIWRYHIVDLYDHIKGPIKVVIDKDDSYFIYKGNAENKHIHLYESTKPIELKDKVTEIFSLRMYPKTSIKKAANSDQQEEVLLERLPLPDVRSLENNVEKGGVFYSNIVVYV